MEYLVVLLIVIAVALAVSRKFGSAGVSQQSPPLAPQPQNAMDQELEERIGEFMEEDRFSLMIQPVMNFRTDTICGGEVLSRLNHPERGMIFPDDFLPAVDAAGLHGQFDRYIFRKSCAWLSRSLAEGEKLAVLSCNFSRNTLSQQTIVEDLAEIADSYGLTHDVLAIEITEQEPKTDAQQFCRNLKQLKAAGFRLFLDDYGTGVTSTQDLMECPLDVVKIDRSVLLAAETEQGKAAYRTMVAMAMELGCEVACEGIETEAQSRFAQEAGCHYGQGFLFFHPMSTDQVFEMMEKSSLDCDKGEMI